MLGLADSHDPTPPIRWSRPWWTGAIAVAVGVVEIVYGAFRVSTEWVTALLFMASGAGFVVLGVGRILSRRRAPGSDGGTADRP